MISAIPSWRPPPKFLMLGSNEVHVWRAFLDLTTPQVQGLEQTLSPEELGRAERYYFQKDRKHFIVARGLLRNILSRYLQIEPYQIRFRYGPHGKPELSGEGGWETLRFNVSHSHGLALYAITRSREIGVDVECIRSVPEAEQIAERFFSTRENAVFRALPPHEKLHAFFNCWTRKEAYIKAIGDGLSRPLDQFDVSLAPGEPARLLHIEGAPQEACHWSIQAPTPASGYIAALAVEGHGFRLSCRQWAC